MQMFIFCLITIWELEGYFLFSIKIGNPLKYKPDLLLWMGLLNLSSYFVQFIKSKSKSTWI